MTFERSVWPTEIVSDSRMFLGSPSLRAEELCCSWSSHSTCHFFLTFHVCECIFSRVPRSPMHKEESRLQQLVWSWAGWFVLSQDCCSLFLVDSACCGKSFDTVIGVFLAEAFDSNYTSKVWKLLTILRDQSIDGGFGCRCFFATLM